VFAKSGIIPGKILFLLKRKAGMGGTCLPFL
jgi:hypothetical protein